MIKSYEDLEVYQRAMKLLVKVHLVALSFPDYEKYELASQMRRASKSIPANIAEGYGRKSSVKDFKSYLTTALGSGNEMLVHLVIARELGYMAAKEANDLIEAYDIVGKQLSKLIQNWK
ncbi:MAG: four helix bundle protein [Chloroflexi bacterium]|nr:four helix bundle protein [Chloroflexota bacterium]